MIQSETFEHTGCKAATSNASCWRLLCGCQCSGTTASYHLVTRTVVVAVKYGPWQPCTTLIQVTFPVGGGSGHHGVFGAMQIKWNQGSNGGGSGKGRTWAVVNTSKK